MRRPESGRGLKGQKTFDTTCQGQREKSSRKLHHFLFLPKTRETIFRSKPREFPQTLTVMYHLELLCKTVHFIPLIFN